jgi:polyhydroxyalkanoate synthesis regulator phasin
MRNSGMLFKIEPSEFVDVVRREPLSEIDQLKMEVAELKREVAALKEQRHAPFFGLLEQMG